MSGHNKWSKIRTKKSTEDAAKSKTFSKMVKLIATASKQVQGDTTSPILRAAIDQAREYNMPASNIERAVKSGTGSDTLTLEAITYEAYGPGGSALIIEAMTDNKNKAAQEIKFILSKYGFELARPGSTTWAFTKEQNEWKPNTTLTLSEADGKVLEFLVEELEDNEEVHDVYTNII